MPIPTGYAQANLIFGNAAAPEGAEVTLGLDISAFGGTITEAGEAVGDAFVAEILPLLTDQVQLQGVLVKYGPDATGPSTLVPYANTGSVTTAGAPPNVAFLIHKETALGGRAGRGRMYLPGVAEAKVSVSGTLEGATKADLDGGFDDFGTALATALLTPVLLHGVGSPVSTPTPITQFTADSKVATQRRRLR